ncbi:uncharacterized protein LOC133187541 [Saccostrea echinata]|uniref:uncharacterized protein LOC133187541 n=1 Tax=Saccostrea echinata TaxID=191078 RepID=UPI002A8054D1|nr:uncharacterized protein LOC133187541 [Saccostrea echinata]
MMSEPKSAKRQQRGRRTQVIPAAAGSAEQAAQQTVQQTAQDQLVAAVTDKVLEAIRNESNQESQQMVETEDRGRKKHREPKKKRKRISSPPRSPSIAGREIQGISTLHGQVPSQHPSGVPTHLVNSTSKLLDAAMSKNTQVSYEVALNAYHKFFRANFSTSPTFPSQLNHIMSFIAWLYQHKKSYNTINTYVAGISYYHKIHGLSDPTQFFVIKKLLKGAQHLSNAPDIRLPITPHILFKLVHALKHTVAGKFSRRLLTAMFTLCFFAFLRVGEVTVKSLKNSSRNLVHLKNLSFDPVRGRPKSMTLTLRHFKHHDSGRPVSLQIAAQTCKNICPVKAMQKYLSVRSKCQGPLFSFDGQKPINQAYFTNELKNALSFVGLDTTKYKSHSFRIGAASYAFQCKIPEDKIRLMGRWNSSAIRRYFRIPVFDTVEISPLNLV